MKADIHPDYTETEISCACGAVYHTRSTKQDIKIGDKVTPDKVQVQDKDPSGVSGTPFTDPSQLRGQPALVDIPTGSQVSQETVLGGLSPVSAQLKPGGLRAATERAKRPTRRSHPVLRVLVVGAAARVPGGALVAVCV